jgi:hypothetical protein
MKWISVKKKLPKNDDWVLVWSTKLEGMERIGCVITKLLHSDSWYCIPNRYVTHWMPLPKQPNARYK